MCQCKSDWFCGECGGCRSHCTPAAHQEEEIRQIVESIWEHGDRAIRNSVDTVILPSVRLYWSKNTFDMLRLIDKELGLLDRQAISRALDVALEREVGLVGIACRKREPRHDLEAACSLSELFG